MKDRRVTAYIILREARERQRKKLEAQRTALVAQRSELLAAAQAKQAEIDQQLRDQQSLQARIATMTGGDAPIKLGELNALRQYLDIIAERRAQLESERARLDKAIQQKEKEIHEMQQRIAKNNGQIDAYQKLIDRIQRAQARTAENALDEQVGEAMLAQQRLKACL